MEKSGKRMSSPLSEGRTIDDEVKIAEGTSGGVLENPFKSESESFIEAAL
jgi:hypothetical protein